MVERIRDATVAEAISSEAGTDATPELVLGDTVWPVVQLQPRPPLASSGYFPGSVSIVSAAVALNTSHCGIFGSGIGRAICRVNWCIIYNDSAGSVTVTMRRLNAPFTGFPSVRAVPGYISAGVNTTGTVFSVTKSDTVAAQGASMGLFLIHANASLFVPGPWILDNGALLIAHSTVNTTLRAAFGYEVWPAIRAQAAG